MVSTAQSPDVPAIVEILNNAYRGDKSRAGWTTEADLLAGEIRSDEATVLELLLRPGVVFKIFKNEAGRLLGCVCLQEKERGLYLGMFAVAPELQGCGIGKKLLAEADKHASALGSPGIFMTVFSVRSELLAWYKRHGYRRTGETRPYEVDPKFGVPTQPLEFLVLEKRLA